jgi:hypothetical protein
MSSAYVCRHRSGRSWTPACNEHEPEPTIYAAVVVVQCTSEADGTSALGRAKEIIRRERGPRRQKGLYGFLSFRTVHSSSRCYCRCPSRRRPVRNSLPRLHPLCARPRRHGPGVIDGTRATVGGLEAVVAADEACAPAPRSRMCPPRSRRVFSAHARCDRDRARRWRRQQSRPRRHTHPCSTPAATAAGCGRPHRLLHRLSSRCTHRLAPFPRGERPPDADDRPGLVLLQQDEELPGHARGRSSCRPRRVDPRRDRDGLGRRGAGHARSGTSVGRGDRSRRRLEHSSRLLRPV